MLPKRISASIILPPKGIFAEQQSSFIVLSAFIKSNLSDTLSPKISSSLSSDAQFSPTVNLPPISCSVIASKSIPPDDELSSVEPENAVIFSLYFALPSDMYRSPFSSNAAKISPNEIRRSFKLPLEIPAYTTPFKSRLSIFKSILKVPPSVRTEPNAVPR